MKNFEVTDKDSGKKYWISRSIAVLALVKVREEPNGPKEEFVQKRHGDYGMTCYAKGNPNYVLNTYILVNKRGEGCPNFAGYWNVPVGYLDYDETLKDACTREVMEEQGVYINPERWCNYLPIDDEIKDGDTKQNVTVRYYVTLTMDEYKKAVEEGEKRKKDFKGEYNEVSDKELMLLTKENINNKEWAFNHKALLEREMEPVTYIL